MADDTAKSPEGDEQRPDEAGDQPSSAKGSSPPTTEMAAVGGADDEILHKRLDKLEELLAENERLRSRSRYIGLIGILLLIGLLVLFVLRVWLYLRHEHLDPIRTDPVAYGTDLADRVELKRVLKEEARASQEVLGEVGKDFGNRLYQRLLDEIPKIEEKAMEMGGNLDAYARKHVEEEIAAALDESLRQSFAELEGEYDDELSEAELQQQMEYAQRQFIVKLTDLLEERYAKVDASLEHLKQAMEKVGASGPEGPRLQDPKKTSVGELQTMMLDALVDLIVYELKPELGELPANEEEAANE